MSFGLSKIVEGADRGLERNRQIQRQKEKDAAYRAAADRAQESHDVNIEHAKQRNQRFGILADREDEIYARQQKDYQTSQMIRTGLMKFEVEGDPSRLIEAYNFGVPDGKEVSAWDKDDKGNYKLTFSDGNEQVFSRQELAAMGITLSQPGALENFRQQQENIKAQSDKQAQETKEHRQFELDKIAAQSGATLSRQLVLENIKSENKKDLEQIKSDLKNDKDSNAKGKLKSADYNAIRNTLESAYGKLDPSGKYVFDGTNSEKYQRSLAIAEKAFVAGLGHGESALIGRQIVSGKITERDAMKMAKKELQGIDLKTESGRKILNLRSREIMKESNDAFKKAAKLGLFDNADDEDLGDPIVEGYLN